MAMISGGISIIVPIFNTASYLALCIDSVLNQTYTNWELILINDGSTDDSEKICEDFQQNDDRIVLISYGESKGSSYARNCGIEASKGKYLFFLDSDDTIHPALLEEMWDVAEKLVPGVVMSNYDNTELLSFPEEWGSSDLSWNFVQEESAVEWWLKTTFTAKWGIGGKLFKKNQVRMLRFNEQIRYSEDVLFIYNFLKGSNNSLVYTTEKRYRRILRDESVSHESTLIKVYDELRVWHEIIDVEWSFGRKKNVIICEEQLVSLFCNLYLDVANSSLYNIDFAKEIIKKEKEKGTFGLIRYRTKLKYIMCILNPTLYKWLRSVKRKVNEN